MAASSHSNPARTPGPFPFLRRIGITRRRPSSIMSWPLSSNWANSNSTSINSSNRSLFCKGVWIQPRRPPISRRHLIRFSKSPVQMAEVIGQSRSQEGISRLWPFCPSPPPCTPLSGSMCLWLWGVGTSHALPHPPGARAASHRHGNHPLPAFFRPAVWGVEDAQGRRSQCRRYWLRSALERPHRRTRRHARQLRRLMQDFCHSVLHSHQIWGLSKK